jgi:hypothetical protein
LGPYEVHGPPVAPSSYAPVVIQNGFYDYFRSKFWKVKTQQELSFFSSLCGRFLCSDGKQPEMKEKLVASAAAVNRNLSISIKFFYEIGWVFLFTMIYN